MVIVVERIKRLISEIRNVTAFVLDLTKNLLNESLSEAGNSSQVLDYR